MLVAGVLQAEVELNQGAAEEAAQEAEASIRALGESRQDTFDYAYARHLLGRALAACGEDARAEALLVDSFNNMQARLATWDRTNDWFILHAGRSVTDFFDGRQRPAEAARWQRRLGEVEKELAELRTVPKTP